MKIIDAGKGLCGHPIQGLMGARDPLMCASCHVAGGGALRLHIPRDPVGEERGFQVMRFLAVPFGSFWIWRDEDGSTPAEA